MTYLLDRPTFVSPAAFPKAEPQIRDRQEHRLLFGATFVIFLVAAVVMRLLPVFGAGQGAAAAGAGSALVDGGRSSRSIFAEAKAAGYSALAFAFMG